MTYRERRLRKAERLLEWADKRDAKGAAARAASDRISDGIPFGQPILVGHHSERRHRRDIDRIHNGMARSFEHFGKADEFRRRAANIEAAADHAIYSDDEDAVERLEERIAGLEATRERIKRFNMLARGGLLERAFSELPEDEAREHRRTLELCAWQCPKGVFPSYVLSNLSGNIKRQRDRLAMLKRKETA